jgi:hypothetical protein
VKYEQFIRVEGGKITNKLKLADGTYNAKFYSRSARSIPQLNYYWVCMDLMLDGLHEIGYNNLSTKEDVHELMKHMFLRRPIVNEKTGEIIGEITRSTAELTKDEMTNYLTQIDQFCIEYLGFSLPQPNQQLSL